VPEEVAVLVPVGRRRRRRLPLAVGSETEVGDEAVAPRVGLLDAVSAAEQLARGAPHLGSEGGDLDVSEARHVDALLDPRVRVLRVVAEPDPGLVEPRLRVLAREALVDRHVAVSDEGLDLLVAENGVGHVRLPSTDRQIAARATLLVSRGRADRPSGSPVSPVE
jgi:hypothetical protein